MQLASQLTAPTYIESPADWLRLTGKDRIELVGRLCTADMRTLAQKNNLWAAFTTAQGKLIDWVWIWAQGDVLWLRSSAGRGVRLRDWIDRYIIMDDVKVELVPDAWRWFIVYGATSKTIVDSVATQLPLACIVEGPLLAPHRFDLVVDAAQCDSLKMQLKNHQVALADDALAESLRVSYGIPSAHYEYAEEVQPLELRLTPYAISFNKGCYIGQEVIMRLDSYDKLARILMGFRSDAPPQAAANLRIYANGRPIGKVTSWTSALSAGGSVGLAIVKRDEAHPQAAQLCSDTGEVIQTIELEDRLFWQNA